MELKTKKIIARQGLIIISLLLLSVLLISMGFFIKVDLPYRYELSLSGKAYKFNTKNYFDDWSFDDKIGVLRAIKIKNPEDFPNKNLDLLRDDHEIKYLGEKLSYRIQNLCFSLAHIVLFGIYPLYWLTRFIIWAIKTLRKR